MQDQQSPTTPISQPYQLFCARRTMPIHQSQSICQVMYCKRQSQYSPIPIRLHQHSKPKSHLDRKSHQTPPPINRQLDPRHKSRLVARQPTNRIPNVRPGREPAQRNPTPQTRAPSLAILSPQNIRHHARLGHDRQHRVAADVVFGEFGGEAARDGADGAFGAGVP